MKACFQPWNECLDQIKVFENRVFVPRTRFVELRNHKDLLSCGTVGHTRNGEVKYVYPNGVSNRTDSLIK